ncbi:MAG: molybdopterin converting factor subunit 1 [SAR324 cluster bacterium]|nr:molybdopterin converting factor subunit 1 [SAR324 cluster bacterium]
MKITLLYFAQLRESLGKNSEEFTSAEPLTGKELIEALVARYPQMEAVAGSIQLAVNGEYFRVEQILPDSAEVALIPPVSGG